VSGRPSLVAAVAVLALASCRTSSPERESPPPPPSPCRFDVGSGSPDAIARRSACELADSEALAAHAPRAEGDRRYPVRFPRQGPVGTGTLSAFETMVENALVGTGCFLLVDEETAPFLRVRVAGPLGDERSSVELSGPGGDLWVEVRGHLDRPH
jgi:hypothetical protein